MKAEINTVPAFQPVSVTITCETPAELVALEALFNLQSVAGYKLPDGTFPFSTVADRLLQETVVLPSLLSISEQENIVSTIGEIGAR